MSQRQLALFVPLLFLGCESESVEEPHSLVCVDERPMEASFGAMDEVFHVGPYVGHTTMSSVAIGWETEQPGGTRVEYGMDSTYGQVVEGEAGTMHQVVVTGLAPATTYHYRACTDTMCTQDLWFSTAPDASRPIRFAVYGDCQDNPEEHGKLIERALEDSPNLFLVVGDLVSDGNFREQYKERFFDPARRAAHYAPRYAAVGNHDRKDTEVVHFRDYVMYPEDPGVPQPETSYSFVYGDAFFLVIDNTLDHFDLFFPLGTSEPQLYQWIRDQLQGPEAQSATWRFVFAHYPADSNCRAEDAGYGLPETAVRNYLLPLFRETGVQAYFAGHMHCYERFDFEGQLVITTGGGGGGLEPEERCDDGLPEARKHRCVHHHVAVKLGCTEAIFRARANDGTEIDRVRLGADGTWVAE